MRVENENESPCIRALGEDRGGSTTWACLQRRVPRNWAQRFDSFRIKVDRLYRIQRRKEKFPYFSSHVKLPRVFRLS